MQAKADCDAEMATIGPLGARHLVILPEGYTDFDGNLIGQPDPDRRRVDGADERDVRARPVRRRRVRRRARVPHPRGQPRRHAGGDRALPRPHRPRGGPRCASTPGTSRTAAPTTSASSATTRDRIGYVHLKQVDPAIRRRASGTSSSGSRRRSGSARWSSRRSANRTCRPCWRRSAALDRELFCIVEQDLYPCDPDVPLPIATRTREYFAACGLDVGPIARRRPPHLATERRHDDPRRRHRHRRHRDRPRPQARPRDLRVRPWRPSPTSTGPAPRRSPPRSAARRSFDDGFALIASDDVDAVLDRLDRPRPTPRSPSPASPPASPSCARSRSRPPPPECEQVLEAEVALGRRLVIVGFMRRYDPGYRQVKASLDGGAIGERADPPQRPPQPDGAGLVHELHDDDRLDHPRDRHQPLAAGRGDRGGPGHPAAANAEGVRRTSRTRSSRCSRPSPAILVDGRVLRQLPVRLRRPLRARGLRGDGVARATRSSAGAGDGRDRREPGAAQTGGCGSAPPTRPSCRPGSAACERGETVGPSAWDGYAATGSPRSASRRSAPASAPRSTTSPSPDAVPG